MSAVAYAKERGWLPYRLALEQITPASPVQVRVEYLAEHPTAGVFVVSSALRWFLQHGEYAEPAWAVMA